VAAAVFFCSACALAANYTAIDLTPSGSLELRLTATRTQQVGYGRSSATGNESHACFGNGSAASRVDLNPSGFTSSSANGTNGTQQVGSGYNPASGSRALLWSGSANNYVDLSPSGSLCHRLRASAARSR